jgi:NDP-sugar pyrophosphorylase family protein
LENRFERVKDIKAILLVGGLGTRLRSVVPSVPKPLASVGDTSFLELLIRQLQYQGISRLVMCTGHMGDQIENEFGDGHAWDVAIEYSRELQPLGTAGAVKLAQPYIGDAPYFLVMNGDSFLETNFHELVAFHSENRALATMAVLQVQNASRFGTVQLDSRNRVIGFLEKTGCGAPGIVNAGVYVFDSALFDHIPKIPSSLERDVFPRVLKRGIYALEHHGMFIDIGTPEDYARGQLLSDRLYATAFQPHAPAEDK